jgi:hypothetical protein
VSGALTVTVSADTQPFDDALATALASGQAFARRTFIALIDAHVRPFLTKHSEALRLGREWARQTFTAAFDVRLQAVYAKAAEAHRLGRDWAQQTFIAHYDLNLRAVTAGYHEAMALGRDWSARTFWARFAIDTSPLWAALGTVRTVAQEIRDLLPSSPAKKGPLSRPVSFAYIAEAVRRDLAPVPGLLAGALTTPGSRRLGGGWGGPVYHVNVVKIVTVPPDEWLRVAREAQTGARFAQRLPRELELMLAGV